MQEDKRKIRYIIEKYPYERLVECVELNGRCFTEEALLENNLEISDLLHIVELIPQLIEDLEQGRKSKLWDKLQEDVFELLLHVSANRIFRLLFVQFGGIQFLNGFIKKTPKTPAARDCESGGDKKTVAIRCEEPKQMKLFMDELNLEIFKEQAMRILNHRRIEAPRSTQRF